MMPAHFEGMTAMLVTLGIGFCFGFVLEKAGFGNAHNLAAQFYLYDMRVLKVMFTAIITAMLLIFVSSALGWMDFSALFVPPTHLGPAIVGGFVLGIGFIIGGYCPGTSLVSMSTWKVDGAFFVLGVMSGLWAFALSVPTLWVFWNQTGFLDRLTWPDLLGIDAGWIVLAVFVMAIGAFWCAEQVERMFRRESQGLAEPVARRTKILRRAGVATGLAVALLTVLVGQPSVEQRIAWKSRDLDKLVASRDVFIDPAELLDLMHNNQIRLLMLDVRDGSDFNLFHLLDARQATVNEVESLVPANPSPETVVVTMSNDEEGAIEAWKRLKVHGNLNAYVLAGGVNRWLDVYQDQLPNIPGPEAQPGGSDVLRHVFTAALGDRLESARPPRDKAPSRPFTSKVKVLKPVRAPGGGCG